MAEAPHAPALEAAIALAAPVAVEAAIAEAAAVEAAIAEAGAVDEEADVAVPDDLAAANVEDEDDEEDEEVEADDAVADDEDDDEEGEEEAGEWAAANMEHEDNEGEEEEADADDSEAVQPVWSMEAIAHTMAEYVVHAFPLPADSPLRVRFPHAGDAAGWSKHQVHTSLPRCELAANTSTAAAEAAVALESAKAEAAAAEAEAAATEAAVTSLVNDGAADALLSAASLYHHDDDGGVRTAAMWDALTALAVAAPGSVPTLVRDGVATALLTATAPSTPLPVTAAALRTLAAVCSFPAGAVALDGYGAIRYVAKLVATLTRRHGMLVAAPALHGAFCLVAALSRGLAAAGHAPDWCELEVAAVAVTAMWTVSAAATHGAACGEDAAKETLAALAVWSRFAGIVATAGATPDALHCMTGCYGATGTGMVAPRRPQPSVAIVPPSCTSPHTPPPPADCFHDETCVARMAARVMEVCAHLGRVPPGGVPAGMLTGILTHFPDNVEVLPAVFRAVVACSENIGDKQEAALAAAVLNALAVVHASRELAHDKATVDTCLAALSQLLPHLRTSHEVGVSVWEQLAAVVEPHTHSVDTAVLAMTAMAAAAKRTRYRNNEDHPALLCVPIVTAALAACGSSDADALVSAATRLLVVIANRTGEHIAGGFADHILSAAGVVGPWLSPSTVAALLSATHAGDPLIAARVAVLLAQAHHDNRDVMDAFCSFVKSTARSDARGAVLAGAGCSTLLWDALRHHGLGIALTALAQVAKYLPPGELTPPGACRDVTALHRSSTATDKSFISPASLLGLQLAEWEKGAEAALPEADAADACRAVMAAAAAMPQNSDVVTLALTAAKSWATRGSAAAAPDLCSVHLWRCVTSALANHVDDAEVVAVALDLVATLRPVTWDTVPKAETVATASALLVTAVRHPDVEQVPAAVAVLPQLAAASPAARRHLWRVNAAGSLPVLAGCMPPDADGIDDSNASLPPPTWHAAMHRMAAGAGGNPSPALVLLSSGVVLQAAVLQWLEPSDAQPLRVCPPAMAAAVAEHVWDSTSRRNRVAAPGGCSAWARAMPASWTVRIPGNATAADMHALGDLRRLSRVCVDGTAGVAVTALLPRTISTLHVSGVLEARSLAHLTALETLIVHRDITHKRLELPASLRHCHLLHARGVEWHNLATVPPLWTLALRRATMSPAAVTALPCSLQSLDLATSSGLHVTGVSVAHIVALHHVDVACTDITDAVLATLPAGLLTLDVSDCRRLTPAVSCRHLGALVALRACGTSVSDETLVTGIPPSVVLLGLARCRNLTAAATCAALPALRHLDVSKTDVGVATLASLPVGLCDLEVSYCDHVDATARLSHLPCLRALACAGTGISNETLDSCPPTLQYLCAERCWVITDAPDLPHLPELAALDMWSTRVGGGVLGRLPLSILQLELGTPRLTAAAALPPLPRLACVAVCDTFVGAPFVASIPRSVAHIGAARCPRLRGIKAEAAWQSLIERGALDRLAECNASIDDLPPLVVATLALRGVGFGRATCNTCATRFPTLRWTEGTRHEDDAERDPFAPGFENQYRDRHRY